MRELEFRITEIHSEQDFKMLEWLKMSDVPYVKVDLTTTSCYGSVKRTNQYWTAKMWDKIKEQGYFLG